MTVDELRAEAEMAGVGVEEYAVFVIDNARRISADNASLYEREMEIRLDYENLCAGLICPDCGFEPIKVGHGAECG